MINKIDIFILRGIDEYILYIMLATLKDIKYIRKGGKILKNYSNSYKVKEGG